MFAVNAEEDAVVNVVCPVTLRVEERAPEEPVIAPRVATVE